ncbi:MAG: diaminopimelate epimerase [Eubacteriales bacterium]|nr:diaminopimelate epimerase [Eubacteriales bacterium]
MKFTKMEGLGNDYVYVNCLNEQVVNPKEVAIKVSDRHFGIGSDGLILIKASDVADFCMEMYNADGSQSEMCGNGIRCVGKYVYDYGLTDKEHISVETLAGIKYLDFQIEDGKVAMVTVNMGSPELVPEKIPVRSDKDVLICEPILVDGKTYEMTCVSMGNPHCIVFVDNTATFPLEEVGPKFEMHTVFPNRVNAEFIQIIDRKTVNMRVWERGTGETLACGTGACASTVACILNELTEEEITLHLLGGDLKVRWDRDENVVYMTGPAKVVFDGEINDACL